MTTYKGLQKKKSVIGDNHGMSSIKIMTGEGIVSIETYHALEKIYDECFDLLVADGGAGAIHGDPADALRSDSEGSCSCMLNICPTNSTPPSHW